MSQKRKVEEYHDPDYPQSDSNNRSKRFHASQTFTAEERLKKIREIIKREFQKEIANKEAEIHSIDERLEEAKMLLHKVRYSAVVSYYSSKNLQLTETETVQATRGVCSEERANDKQMAIHPAIKTVLGASAQNYDELLKVRPIREAAKTAQSTIKEKFRTKREEKRLQRLQNGKLNRTIPETQDVHKKVPRYVDPVFENKKIEKLNSSRGGNKTQHLIVVGNTSKYIGEEMSLDAVTHKWLVYIKFKDSSMPLESVVSRVRFFLHSSYKPNDVVDVTSPPFQIARRGWGEFPLRLQLFFKDYLQQKPVQLIHTLVLDRTLTGLQTIGSETVVEMWLNSQYDLKEDSLELLKDINNEKEEDAPNTDCLETMEDGLIKWLNISKTEREKNVSHENSINFCNMAVSDESLCNNIDESLSKSTTRTAFSSAEQKVYQDIKSEPSLDIPSEILNAKNTTDEFCETKPKVMTKKLIKFIDKQGNTKFVEVFVRQGIRNTPVLLKRINGGIKLIKTNLNSDYKNVNIIDHSKNIDVSNSLNTKKIDMQSLPSVSKTTEGEAIKNHRNEVVIESAGAEERAAPCSNIQSVRRFQTVLQNSKLKTPIIVKDGKMCIIEPLKSTITQESKNQQSLLKPQLSLLKPMTKNQNIKLDTRTEISKNPRNHLDGKMCTIEPLKSTFVQDSKKQQSLLRPQVSLLKTMTKIENLKLNTRPEIGMNPQSHPEVDHKYLSTVGVKESATTAQVKIHKQFISNELPKISKTITVQKDENSRITVVVDTVENESKRRIEPTADVDYKKELESKFFAINFSSCRYAVEFLLKKLPLINPMATRGSFRERFPFVVLTEGIFKGLITPKQKSLEWLRAKCIQKLLHKHVDLQNSESLWTTKEIVLFARHHAYTPVIEYKKLENTVKVLKKNGLRDVVKNEIKREPLDQPTLSRSDDVQKWINLVRQKISGELKCSDEIINVDGFDDAVDTNRQHCSDSPSKNAGSKDWLPLDQKLENLVSLASETCQNIGFRFRPEEIIPGVLHSSAQAVIAHSLRCFVEDLVRRSISVKNINECKGVSTLHTDDVKEAILRRPQFDFLTNKDLGISIAKDTEE